MLCLSQLGEYSRVEHLAKAFFFSRWKEAYMAMFTVYFDASGHPDGTSVFSVAGFIANAQQWIDIQDGWESVLARYEIQGYNVSGLEAIYQVVEHFGLHYGQILYIAKSLTSADLGLYRELDKTGRAQG